MPSGRSVRSILERGEAVRVLPGRLGSEGDAELALKPPVVRADGGERLDGEMGQRQLSSHHDDEV